MNGSGGPDAPRLVRQLTAIPDERRDFTISPRRALAYGITAPMVTELIDLGLPHLLVEGELRLDRHDLINLSLDLGRPSAWMLSMRYWASALAFDGPVRRGRVKYTFTCPDPSHAGPCTVDVLTPDRGWQQQKVERAQAGDTLDVVSEFELGNRWPALPPEILELVADLRDIQFKVLPWGLSLDEDFIRKTGWADCAGAAQLLVAEAGRRGIVARFSLGLAVFAPYSVLHCWADFLIDGVWVPLDPFMIASFVRWGLVDARRWDPFTSTGVVLGRLAATMTAPNQHNHAYVHLTMPTTLVTDRR